MLEIEKPMTGAPPVNLNLAKKYHVGENFNTFFTGAFSQLDHYNDENLISPDPDELGVRELAVTIDNRVARESVDHCNVKEQADINAAHYTCLYNAHYGG